MDKNDVREKLVQSLRQVQESSGRPVGELDSDTKPIGELEGFDSLSGVETTVHLSELLGHEISNENIFFSEDGSRALSVEQITDSLHAAMGSEDS